MEIKRQLVYLVAIWALQLICVQAATLRIKKERNTVDVPETICSGSTPCGWEVYSEVNKQVRTSNYFVYSPCRCGENMKCTRDNDDVMINSYVHRCKPFNNGSRGGGGGGGGGGGVANRNEISRIETTTLKTK